MTEEEKLRHGAEIREMSRIARDNIAKMTPEELDAITDEGLCAASLEEQEKMGEFQD